MNKCSVVLRYSYDLCASPADCNKINRMSFRTSVDPIPAIQIKQHDQGRYKTVCIRTNSNEYNMVKDHTENGHTCQWVYNGFIMSDGDRICLQSI